MAFKNDGPQVNEYVYDFAVDGGAVSTIDLSAKQGFAPLPSGAVVKSVHYKVVSALTSGGSATVSIGDANATARYLALTAFDNAAYAAGNVAAAAIGVPMNVSAAARGQFGISIAVAALTAGKIVFFVEFFQSAQE
ncbi:MAG: hypothetical protein IPP74_15500 [Alphaproteobacteria bacterium]|nr:hypothetical protein [Alphaproteobacteria bacterium]